MPIKQLKQYLDEHQVKYISISHSPAFTSQEIAATAHISGKQLAKTVVVKLNEQMALVVVPAHEQVNFEQLQKLAGVATAILASEAEFKGRFPECEVGAMPPLGSLYEMPVYVSAELAAQGTITFNAGSHAELIQLSFNDFMRLVKPTIIEA